MLYTESISGEDIYSLLEQTLPTATIKYVHYPFLQTVKNNHTVTFSVAKIGKGIYNMSANEHATNQDINLGKFNKAKMGLLLINHYLNN